MSWESLVPAQTLRSGGQGLSWSVLIPDRCVCVPHTSGSPEGGRSSPASSLSQRRFHFRDLAVLTGPLSPGTTCSPPFSAQAAQEAPADLLLGSSPFSPLSAPGGWRSAGSISASTTKTLLGGLSVHLHHHSWPLKGVQKALWNK